MINNLSMNMKLDKRYSPYNHIYKSILSKLHCIYNLTSSYLLVYKKKHVRKAKGKKKSYDTQCIFFYTKQPTKSSITKVTYPQLKEL